LSRSGPLRGGRTGGERFAAIVAAELIGFVVVNGTGVGYFLGYTEFVQLVDDLARLHFQLPREFIDSNLTHMKTFRLMPAPTRQQITFKLRE
jgi:hypothetical protein